MIINANALHIPLADKCVNTVVTSPPYYGLRDYGVNGQLGLEPTPDEYIANLLTVFRECKRILRDDGTLWVNIGDSFYTQPAGNKKPSGFQQKSSGGLSGALAQYGTLTHLPKLDGIKQKDLIGIPWMLAFALRADGWYLRSDIIWAKRNCMPESVKDRPTKSHEYIFLLSKSQSYYYDYQAILEPATGFDGRKDTMFKGAVKSYNGVMPGGKPQSFAQNGHERWQYKNLQPDGQQPNTMHLNRLEGEEYLSPVRNKRDVWFVSTKPYNGAHYATFPPELITPCILAGAPEGGIVFDPFVGSGTTVATAIQLGRRGIGLDLSLKYLQENARQRIDKVKLPLLDYSPLTPGKVV